MFTRTHLTTDLADILIFKLAIRSWSGIFQYNNLNDELLTVHDSMNEKDNLHLFLYHNTSSSSSSAVKTDPLRNLRFFKKNLKNKPIIVKIMK